MPKITDALAETKSRKLITAGWDDVPHLDRRAREEVMAETPPWLREARSKGIPSLGAGAIYPIPTEQIEVEPFAIPSHWPRAYSLDVGWNWTAALWMAFDRETLTRYLYAEYKASEALPSVHADAIKARGEWIPGLIDPAANNRAPRDGERLMADYVGLGLDLTPAVNAVEAGLVGCWRDLSIGRIKIFKTLQRFKEEYRVYRRDEKGKVVKKNDHLMDDMRYLYNSGFDVMKVRPAQLAGPGVPVAPVGPGGY
jgi:hypothetical protein